MASGGTLLCWACDDVRQTGAPTDLAVAAHDLALAAPDSGTSGGCASLSSLDPGVRVATFELSNALIAPSLNLAWLVSHRDGAAGDLYELSIPSMTVTQRAKGVGKISWLGKGGDLLVHRAIAGKKVHHDLLHVARGGAKARVKTLASEVCLPLATPDGGLVFWLKGCAGGVGRLEQLDMASGKVTRLEQAVSATELILNASGTLLAYMVPNPAARDCHVGTGSLRVRKLAAGTWSSVGQDVFPASYQFLPDGERLLHRQVLSCSKGMQRLMATLPGQGKPVTLIERPGACFSGHGDPWARRWSYAVSPDSTRVLVADAVDSYGASTNLLSVRTNGGGGQVLASDLFPFHKLSEPTWTWTFTSDGRHVLYLSGRHPESPWLKAVPVGGGTVRTLYRTRQQPHFSHATSRAGAMVAFVEQGRNKNILKYIDLNQPGGGVQALYGVTGSLRFPGWLADGRGLLAEQSLYGGFLLYIDRSRKQGKVLGNWMLKYWVGTQGPYVMDPSSCLVIYSQDHGSPTGTYLRRLPGGGAS